MESDDMKRHIITLLITIASIITLSAGDEGARIQFLETTHDFGIIREADGPVTYEFEFQNTGDKPLVIISAKAGCGCTTPKFPKEPIRPGEKEKIKITYNPAGRPGEFNKDIKIRTNAKGKKPILTISGCVIPRGK